MSIIVPTITAYTIEQYAAQLKLVSSMARRIHIDYMDGAFAPTQSVSVRESWWPKRVTADLHIMHEDPMQIVSDVIAHRPHLVIVHAEALHASSFVHELHEHRIKVGIALLQDTPADVLRHFIKVIDHVLIFSGNLGHHGGVADLSLLQKVHIAKSLRPNIEIGWDGGINQENIVTLADAGVDVFNVGSALHAAENPQNAYQQLVELVQS